MKTLITALLIILVVAIPAQAQDSDYKSICEIETGGGQSSNFRLLVGFIAIITAEQQSEPPEFDSWTYKYWFSYPQCNDEVTLIKLGFTDETKEPGDWVTLNYESVTSVLVRDNATREEVVEMLRKPFKLLRDRIIAYAEENY